MRISGKNAQGIVDQMKAAIHRDINIMNEEGVILASTNPARQGQLHQGALRVIRENLPSLVIREDLPEQGVQRGINLPVTIDGKLEGVIGITGEPDQVSAFGTVIQRMTEILLENMRRQEQQALLEQARGLFLENWLFSAGPDWTELETRGRLLGLNINAPYRVAILGLEKTGKLAGTEEPDEMRSGRIPGMIRNRIQEHSGSFCAVIRSAILVLLCDTGREEAFETVRQICRDIESYCGFRPSAGISDCSTAPGELRRCYMEAKTARTVAAQSPERRVVFYDQVSLEFIVQSIPASIRQNLNGMLFSACTPQEREEFAQTVRAYFEFDGNLQKCAAHLYIHRNTFQYRIDRLRKKTGYDLKVPRDGLLLYLALQ